MVAKKNGHDPATTEMLDVLRSIDKRLEESVDAARATNNRLTELRGDMIKGFAEVRDEIGELRAEVTGLRNEVTGLRTETRGDLAGVRLDVHEMLEASRTERTKERVEVLARVTKLEDAVFRKTG